MESTQLPLDVWGTDCHYNKMEPGHHPKLQCKDREKGMMGSMKSLQGRVLTQTLEKALII